VKFNAAVGFCVHELADRENLSTDFYVQNVSLIYRYSPRLLKYYPEDQNMRTPFDEGFVSIRI